MNKFTKLVADREKKVNRPRSTLKERKAKHTWQGRCKFFLDS